MNNKILEFAGKIASRLSSEDFKILAGENGVYNLLKGYGYPEAELKVLSDLDKETVTDLIYNKCM